MKPTRLNFAALRSRDQREENGSSAPPQPAGQSIAKASGEKAISRRRMLGLGMSSAVAAGMAVPHLRALGGALGGALEIVEGRDRVALHLGGVERFVIDAARFAGRPRVEVLRNGATCTLSLLDARWPGTDLPADLTLTIRPGLLNRTATIETALGMKATVRLEPWLQGRERAVAPVRLNHTVCALGGNNLRLRGDAELSFAPDWSLGVEGERVGRCKSLGANLSTSRVHLRLPAADEVSLIAPAVARRTAIHLERGEHVWPIIPKPLHSGLMTFLASGSPFDLLSIEAGESGAGYRRHAVVAESVGDESTLAVVPSRGLPGSNGRPAVLPLRRARLAVAYDAEGDTTAVTAQFADPVWIHAHGSSLLVGDEDGHSRFELVARGGVAESFVGTPSLLAALTRLADGGRTIVEPARPAVGSLVTMRLGSVGAPLSDGAYLADLLFDPDRPIDPPAVVVSAPIRIVRPEDLVVLDVMFHNMSVQTVGGKRQIIRTGSPAYLILQFQPQAINEQAFFETESGEDPTDPLIPPPVASRIAEPSRLAFKVPASQGPIDFTMETILDLVRRWEMNLIPTGEQPPDAPPITFNLYDLQALDYDMVVGSSGISVEGNKALKDAMTGAFVRYKGGTRRTIVVNRDLTRRTAVKSVANADETALVRFDTPRFRRTTVYKQVQREYAAIDRYKGVVVNLKPELRPPSAAETVIEAPFRMLLSPNNTAAWAHSPKPVVGPRTGRAELWHTRLGVQGSDGIRDDGQAPESVAEGETQTSSSLGTATANDFAFEGESYLRTVRAVWARDEHFLQYELSSGNWAEETKAEYADGRFISRPKHFPSNPDDWSYRASLDAADRFDIVHLSANYWISGYKPKPIRVDRLMLSALGAWMNVRGAWTVPGGKCTGITESDAPYPGDFLSVEEWRHRMAMGRDTYVRVVYKGYLFPFGHQASLIKVTERKFHKNKPGNPAYLRQRMYIVVREPERTYLSTGLTMPASGGLGERKLDLEMPLMRVKLQTLVTPSIEKPEDSDISSLSQSLFWVRVNSADFMWHIEAEDFDGHVFSFTAPLIFMENSKKQDPAATAAAIAKYNAGTWDGDTASAAARKARPTRPLEGAMLTIAPTAASPDDPTRKPGDTTFETTEVTFSAEQLTMAQLNTLGKCDNPLFYPCIRAMRVIAPAIRGITGSKQPGRFTFHPRYLQYGFASGANQNSGELMLAADTAEVKLKMSFQTSGDKSGGLAKPNMALSGLSRKLGPVSGDSTKVASGTFDPKDTFPSNSPDVNDMLPLIFGCIPLGAIINGVAGLAGMPNFINEIGNQLEEFVGRINKLVEQGKQYADTAVATAKGAVEIGQAASALVAAGGAFPGQVSAASAKVASDPYEAKNDLINALNGLKGKVDGVKIALNGYDGFTAGPIQSARNTAISALTTLSNGIGSAVQGVQAASAQASAITASVNNAVSQANALVGQVNSLGSTLSSFTSISPASAANSLLDMIGLTPIINGLKLVIGDVLGPENAYSALGSLFGDANSNAYHTGGTHPDKNEDGLIGFFGTLAGAVSDPTATATQIQEKLTDFKADLDTLRLALQGYSGPSVPDLDAARAQVVGFIQDVENAIQTILDGLDLFVHALEALTEQKIHLEWRPTLQSFSFLSSPGGDSDYIFLAKDSGKNSTFAMIVEFGMKSESSGSPYFKVDCSLNNFTVNLIAPLTCIALHFDKIQFLADQGMSPDVNVLIRDIEFVGPLSFIETLKDIIPLDGFSDPPGIDVSEKGITASYSLALPNISVGVFSLTNLSINAGFTIPFIGEPLSVNFSICTRDNPFSLTVYIFGGGGFFGITLNPSGIHVLEVSFEFGLQGSIDFGIAGGSVKLVAGIYFKLTMDTDPTSCTVTGYLKLQGKIYLLFITASLTLSLELTYESVSGKMTGKAELTIEIDIPFVPDVHLTYEKKFAGSNGDPSFKEMYEPYALATGETVKPWNQYCAAFCEE